MSARPGEELLAGTIPRLNALRRPLGYARTRWRFRREVRLLRGRHRPTADRPSILHFTTERAASRYVGRVMRALAGGAGMTPLDLDTFFHQFGRIDEWAEQRGGPEAPYYLSRGCYYGPFRTATNHLLNRPDFRYLLSVRDPRDVLVSLHYNYARERSRARLTSASQRRAKREKMEAVKRQSIDDFVRKFSGPDSHILQSYQAYCEYLVGRPEVLLLRYEDMIADFDGWLDSIVAFFGLGSAGEAIEEVRRAADFTPSDTGPRRRVTPGEHLETLAPDTIRTLDAAWRDVLDCLGYGRQDNRSEPPR